MSETLRLEDLKIASPCGVSWDDMRAMDESGRVRHCEHCTLNVYNLSEMARDDATALIRAHEGERLCIRMLRRADGTVITAECPVGLARVRRRLQRMATGIAALFGLAGAAIGIESRGADEGTVSAGAASPFSWISRHLYGRTPPAPPMRYVVMGDICMPSSPAPPITPVTMNREPISLH